MTRRASTAAGLVAILATLVLVTALPPAAGAATPLPRASRTASSSAAFDRSPAPAIVVVIVGTARPVPHPTRPPLPSSAANSRSPEHAFRAAPIAGHPTVVLVVLVVPARGPRAPPCAAEATDRFAVAGGDPVNAGDPTGDTFAPGNSGGLCLHYWYGYGDYDCAGAGGAYPELNTETCTSGLQIESPEYTAALDAAICQGLWAPGHISGLGLAEALAFPVAGAVSVYDGYRAEADAVENGCGFWDSFGIGIVDGAVPLVLTGLGADADGFADTSSAPIPDTAATNAMDQMLANGIHCGTDCSEIAEDLYHAADDRGQILRVEPAKPGLNLRVAERGGDVYYLYHEVYFDGNYVFDPRLSASPIPYDLWSTELLTANPGATIQRVTP